MADRSPWAGSPKWLTVAAFAELAAACRDVLYGELLGLLVALFGFVACLMAAALTVHNRVREADEERRRQAWEERIRDR